MEWGRVNEEVYGVEVSGGGGVKSKRLCKCGHPEDSHLCEMDSPKEWCMGTLGCDCRKYRPGLKLRKKK